MVKVCRKWLRFVMDEYELLSVCVCIIQVDICKGCIFHCIEIPFMKYRILKGNSSEKLPPTFIAPKHSPNST